MVLREATAQRAAAGGRAAAATGERAEQDKGELHVLLQR